MNNSNPTPFFPLSLLLAGVLTWLAQDHVFFWDTVQLGAKHAFWYYENNFAAFLLPVELDSGHPPFFGMLLALAWKINGEPNLALSHWIMFPFLAGILYQLSTITRPLFPAPYLPLLIFLDPVLLSQATLVTPDIPLVFFFLVGVNAAFNRREGWLAVAVVGLAMISMRGMMTAAGLYLYLVLSGWNEKEKGIAHFWKQALPFVPGGLVALAFLGIHYAEKGWIGYHADSPWAPGFERVAWGGLAKNIAVAGWRWLDFGRVFIWIGLAVLLWKGGRKTLKQPEVGRVLRLFLCITGCLSISFLLYSGLQAHRYLLPAFLSFTLLFCAVLAHADLAKKWKTGVFLLVFLGLITGNRWVYPDSVSQGWDATLAHWPYYRLRDEMLDWMQAHSIPLDSVGTAFPEIGPVKYRDLSDNIEGMPEKNLKTQRWILYSNVMNDFTDQERAQLKSEWTPVRVLERGGVRMVLFGKSG